jgi:hypothetical protein
MRLQLAFENEALHLVLVQLLQPSLIGVKVTTYLIEETSLHLLRKNSQSLV